DLKSNLVECITASGEQITGQLIRLGRFDAVIDLPGNGETLRVSEAWRDCKISVDGRILYQGPCTVSQLIDDTESTRCEVQLGEKGVDTGALPSATGEELEKFLQGWLTPYQLSSAFKVAV